MRDSGAARLTPARATAPGLLQDARDLLPLPLVICAGGARSSFAQFAHGHLHSSCNLFMCNRDGRIDRCANHHFVHFGKPRSVRSGVRISPSAPPVLNSRAGCGNRAPQPHYVALLDDVILRPSLTPACTRILQPVHAWNRHSDAGLELPWVAYLL
jgi:hypothetical protein